MIFISVIVPIHNTKRYIEECINSIICQSLKNIEIICVDSSNDGTTDILYQFQEIDNRIIVIEDSNSSYGYKLNLGISQAKGKYISIIESDDYIAEDMLEEMYQVADSTEVDFVKANYEGFVNVNNKRFFCPKDRIKDCYYNKVINLKDDFYLMPYVDYNIWTGIYKASFLSDKKIKFHESEGASYQDVGFANLVTMLADNIYFMKNYFYKYRMDNEFSSVKSNDKYMCIYKEFSWLKHQMKLLGCDNKRNNNFLGIMKLNSYYWNYLRLSDEYRNKLISELPDEELDDFDSEMFDYKIPWKRQILNLYQGDREAVDYEIRKEKQKKDFYNKIQEIVESNNKIVIVCAGMYGKSVYKLLQLLDCSSRIVICDNYLYDQYIESVESPKILPVKEAVIQNADGYFLIANKNMHNDLVKQMGSFGVKEEKMYICNHIGIGMELFLDFVKYCRN